MLSALLAFFLANVFTVIGLILAVAVIVDLFTRRQRPANLFAWGLFAIILPYLAAPLYFLFGGRKLKRLAQQKKALQARTEAARGSTWSDGPLREPYPGNDITLLPDGVTALRGLLHEIDKAEESIFLMTFIFSRDRVASAVFEKLCERAEAGLQVRLLVDGLGSFRGLQRLKRLRRHGGEVAFFIPVLPLQPSRSAHLRNHRKIAIFDSQRAIVGGQNVDCRFLSQVGHPGLFHDFSVRLDGPVVQPLTDIFLSDWAFAAHQDPQDDAALFARQPREAGEHTLEVIPSGPDTEGDPLYERLVLLISQARHRITIVTPYFIPDEVLLRLLIVRARAGLKVEIVVPLHSNHRLVDYASRPVLRALAGEGITIRPFVKGMLHAKLLIVDNRYALTGSANLDPRSLFVNFEVGIVYSSQDSIDTLLAWVDKIRHDTLPFDETRMASASRSERIKEDLAHLLAPVL